MKSLSSFRDYCKINHPTIIIYNDENNTKYTPTYPQRGTIYDPLKMCLTFESIDVFFNPNTVILKGYNGIMCFHYVIGVNIEMTGNPLGDIVTLYCSNNKVKASYVFIMR